MGKIKIILSKNISKEQEEEIREIFASEGLQDELPSSFGMVAGLVDVPPGIIFAFSGLAGGILGAIGKDAWDAFRRVLIRVYTFLREKWKQNPQLLLNVDYEDNRVIIMLPAGDSDLIEKAVNKLQEYMSKRPSRSGRLLFDRESHEWIEWIRK